MSPKGPLTAAAPARQQHYQKVEEELDALRTQSAARLDMRIQESRAASKQRLEQQLENLRTESSDKLHQQMIAGMPLGKRMYCNSWGE